MCNYFNNNNQREIYVETISRKLIGPGADTFGLNTENEIISREPTKLYYSGILFSDAYSNPEAEEDLLPVDLDVDTDDVDTDDVDDNAIDNKNFSGDHNSEPNHAAFQSFYSSKFGLVFALEQKGKIKLTFDFATYAETRDRKVKITQNQYNELLPILTIFNAIPKITADFGADFFKPTYNPVSEELSLTYHPTSDKFITDKKYKDDIKQAFGNNEYLKNKFIYKLCARAAFQRTPHIKIEEIDLNDVTNPLVIHDNLKAHFKCFQKNGKWIVKVLLKNTSDAKKKDYKDCFYQIGIKVEAENFVDYKNEFQNAIDEDYDNITYQYRDVKSYGKGINCAVEWDEHNTPIKYIKTTFIPQQEINNFSNEPNKELEGHKDIFEVKNLSIWSELKDDVLITKLKAFVDEYYKWIAGQTAIANQNTTGLALVSKQKTLYERLIKNINYLEHNQKVFESFKLANTAMFIQMIIAKDKRFEKGRSKDLIPTDGVFDDLSFFEDYYNNIAGNSKPAYRPFQLAFLLMNVESTFNKDSADRNDIVDLIWFPTGGGKTEAYLALTALTIIERRRHNTGQNTNGISVMMRYTLRLLTAQQFERATWLICALEFMRDKLPNYNLGIDRITIGMWVGSSTSPNKFQQLGEAPYSIIFQAASVENAERENKFPISYCPWCGCGMFSQIGGNVEIGFEKIIRGAKKGLDVVCINNQCHYNNSLPIQFIDEGLYENPPTLLFATVDKMVQLSHKKEARDLFFKNKALPPDLIVQDELHLLTGPLGSVAGLYELLIQGICTRDGRKPKIVASTATTRNTKSLIKAMYGRDLNIFPAQGVTFDDNFFSFLDKNTKRKHIGILPTGKTAGLTEIKVVEALFEAKVHLLKCFLKEQNIDINNTDALCNILNSADFKNKMDPYWTFVLYYNNLRDLGRSKSRVSIDFKQQIEGMFRDQNIEPVLKFIYNRLFSHTVEFTSRQESGKIKSLLSRIEKPISFLESIQDGKTYINKDDSGFDLALASNMFSVGIDVTRLNLMLMLGQPGNVAEYIQSSSRVARREKGLVINLLNPMRIRELSIFEDYKAFHMSYYKNIEPLSITPFTTMAIDMIFNAVFVGYMRTIKNIYQVPAYQGNYKDNFIDYINSLEHLDLVIKEKLIDKANKYNVQWEEKIGQTVNITNNSQINNGIFDLMNSLRDIDKDVYILNKNL